MIDDVVKGSVRKTLRELEIMNPKFKVVCLAQATFHCTGQVGMQRSQEQLFPEGYDERNVECGSLQGARTRVDS